MEEEKITVTADKSRSTLYILIGMLLGAALSAAVILLVWKNSSLAEQKPSEGISSGGTLDGIISDEAQAKLQQIRTLLEKQFLFESDQDSIDTGILKGYVDSFGDPYTVYYTPEEYKVISESTTGTYCGIGVVVTQNAKTGLISVVRPYKNCPGEEAGIRSDDIIYKVNGSEVTGIDLDLVVADIRGEAGTTVDMTVFRPSTGEYIDMTVERRRIEVETIAYEMREDQIGYIEMSAFEKVTGDQFTEAFRDLKSQGMKGLILDIRDNGGGLLDTVVAIADYLLPQGIITYTVDIAGNRETFTSDEASALDIPFVLLVNGNSASASEILTACIQDYEAGTVVGTKTFGKGIVQVLYPLEDGSAVKLTYSRYYTPNDVCIHGEGITPDVVLEDDPETEEDEQLQEAVRILREQIH